MNKTWLIWLALVLVSFLVLETIGYMRFGEPGTLSAHVRNWSYYHPLVPFALGVIVGVLAIHFWAAVMYSRPPVATTVWQGRAAR